MKCFVLLLCVGLLPVSAVPRSSVKVTSIGCFYDIMWRRAISSLEGQDPLVDGDNYKSRKDAIEKCASVAKKRGYKVFAVQDGGMCLSSSTAHKTFHIYGTSRRCTSNGRGGDSANHVYVIGGMKDLYSTIEYDSIGCYKHDPSSTMTSLEGKDTDVLDGNYTLRTDAISKCALAASKSGYDVFAVHDGGLCLVGDSFNQYAISQDCKRDGKGGSGASHVYIIGGIQALISRTESGAGLGCYKDLPVRAMESLEGQDHLLDGNYKSRKDAVQKCLLVGKGRGYQVVGIQDGGMCVGSATVKGFNKYGISHDCKSDGKGGPWATELYSLEWVPDFFLSAVKYEILGCYKDRPVSRAIPSLEKSDVLLEDSYSQRNDAIQKCALAAKVRGYQTFALQDGGMCLSGPNATETFDKYGKSQGCKNDGKGGLWASQVYNLTGTMEDILSSFRYTKLGCFKDTQARAIPSLEGQDPPVLDGNSTTRKDATRKCALAAKRRGHRVFAVMADGQCASGPNTTENFVKFGYGKNECSAMAVSNDVYVLGYQHVDDLLPFMDYEPVGCYKDSNQRAIQSVDGVSHYDFPDPYLLLHDSKTRKHAIQKCALFAKLQGYKLFAVQDGGQCLTNATAHKTYSRYGESQDCNSDGKGGPWANQVYRLPERKVNITSIGCFYGSNWYPLIPKLEGEDPLLDDNYKSRKDAIQKCASVAEKLGYKVFAVQDGGMCLSSSTAHKAFYKHGTSRRCANNGRGGKRANHVYVIGELKDLYPTIEYDSIGCYKHEPGSTMTSLEGKDPEVLDGSYTLRTDPIAKCALAAIRGEWEVFAVHDGGLCLVSYSLNPSFNKYGISEDCKNDGQGGSAATHVYILGRVQAITSRTESGLPLGCYKDLPVRAIESLEGQDHLLDGDYKSRKDAIQKCILVGKGRGYAVVGIQDGGMCVGSATGKGLNKYGISHDCKSDGKGGPWATEFHGLAEWVPDFLFSVKYESLGCYRDKSFRAIPSLERSDVLLEDSYWYQRNDAIRKCAVAAKVRGYQTFALQDGGMCVSSLDANETFWKYGRSQDCRNDGKGGPWANQVYNLTGTMEDILLSVHHKKLGCFKDAQARAIPSLEGQDPPVLDGNSTARKDATRKCALAAKRSGYKVFAVMADGQCASGSNTEKNFVKFGYGKNECSTMAVSNDVYVLGYKDAAALALLPYLEYESVGCYQDSYEPAIESVDNKWHYDFISPSLLYYDYKRREQAIQKCALFAKLQGYKMFAVQDGGQCLTSATAHFTYNKYGESQDCKSDGKGGPRANQVYRLPERKA